MKVSIISASHRHNSQSKKVSEFIFHNLLRLHSNLDLFSIDLAESSLPLWSPDKKNGEGIWGETWNSISKNLDFLVVGETKPTKRKVEQAKQLKIKIILEKDWNKILNS